MKKHLGSEEHGKKIVEYEGDNIIHHYQSVTGSPEKFYKVITRIIKDEKELKLSKQQH